MRRRGQILPIFVVAMSSIGLIVTFFLNTAMLRTNAEVVIDNSLRSGGIAALFAVDEGRGFERWYIDPVEATAAARRWVGLNLAGDSAIADADYQGLFQSDLDALVARAQGTSGDTAAGIDVEVLNPLPFAMSGESSDADYNGVPEAAELCSVIGSWPQALRSSIDGLCYDKPTVVIRLRAQITTIAAPATLTRVRATRLGTNE